MKPEMQKVNLLILITKFVIFYSIFVTWSRKYFRYKLTLFKEGYTIPVICGQKKKYIKKTKHDCKFIEKIGRF